MMMPKVFSRKHLNLLIINPAASVIYKGQNAIYGAMDYGKFKRSDAAG